ncbi:unnamed protein product [Haemonchus placei]|uniref:G protein-coupled receptor n=1 Tax=Haemonchus placei TaxID=6290 RepID=A0A0N4X8V0_HAEPC|nr:unnamed protein product [Haemonchus placei]
MDGLIPAGNAIVFVSNGPCSRISSRFCLAVYETLIHALAHGLMSQFISFSYRYYILVNTRIPTRLQLTTICLLVYVPSFFLYVINITHHADPEMLREMVLRYHPTYNLDNHTLTGHYSFAEPSRLVTILYLIIPNIPLYILIAVLRRKTYHILENAAVRLRKCNRRLHIQLMKASLFL